MNAALALACALAGFAAGLAFFASLRWFARRLAGGGRVPWARLALVQALRWIALAALLVAAARRGALPLLALTIGIAGARVALVAHAKRGAAR